MARVKKGVNAHKRHKKVLKNLYFFLPNALKHTAFCPWAFSKTGLKSHRLNSNTAGIDIYLYHVPTPAQ